MLDRCAHLSNDVLEHTSKRIVNGIEKVTRVVHILLANQQQLLSENNYGIV
jgi:GMP synthase PP-ATPase subunit